MAGISIVQILSLLLLLQISMATARRRPAGFLRLPAEGPGSEEETAGTRWPVLVAGSNGFGNYRHQIMNELITLPDTNVNALTRDHKTALDIAEDLPLSEDSALIKECLYRSGALRANELNQPRDELRKTVTQIKKDVHTQLEQTKRTNKNVSGIAKELRKLHREGINNATNSVTVVAVLFATVAFAAIFTVPGGNDNNGLAVVVNRASFKIFFIFNAIALFTSLVVVVQITLVRGDDNYV